MKMTPQTLTCVLVDDEQSNLDILINFVKQIPYLELKATFVKPLEALTYLLKTPTDLLVIPWSVNPLRPLAECPPQPSGDSNVPSRLMSDFQIVRDK